jgi:AmiR/NasT family two-component response regulator
MSSGSHIDFRLLRIVTVLPRDAATETLIRSLQRLGGVIEHHWPPPARLAAKPDIVIYLVGEETLDLCRTLAEQGCCAMVGVVEPGNPRAAQLSAQTNPHALLTKPFDSAVVLTSLVLARNNSLYQRRLLNKIAKLEETLRSIRKVERAKTILMRERKLDESQAYAHLREQAMKKRVPIGAVAGAVIESDEILSGGGNPTRPREG